MNCKFYKDRYCPKECYNNGTKYVFDCDCHYNWKKPKATNHATKN